MADSKSSDFDKENPSEKDKKNKNKKKQQEKAVEENIESIDAQENVAVENAKKEVLHRNACLMIEGDDDLAAEFIRLLKYSKWFYECKRPANKILNSNKYRMLYNLKPKCTRRLAWFLFQMYDAQLLTTDFGKGYMQVACQFIYCNGKPLNADYMLRLNSTTKANLEKYDFIISVVEKMMKSLEKVYKKPLSYQSKLSKKL